MLQDEGTIVRTSQRHEVSLPARFCVAERHRDAVHVLGHQPGRDLWIDADVVDLSTAGLGLISLRFVPRGALVRVLLYLGPPSGDTPDADAPLLELGAAVRRVSMTDRRPAYFLGCSLVDPAGEQAGLLLKLFEQLERGTDPQALRRTIAAAHAVNGAGAGPAADEARGGRSVA